MLAAFDRQMRRDVSADSPTARIERVGDVVRQVGADHDWRGVVYSDLRGDRADAAIAAQVRHFAAAGQEFEWKLYGHDQPADLAARLRAAGFAEGEPETVMVAESNAQAAAVALPEDVSLRPVVDAADAELVAEVHRKAFGDQGDHTRIGPRLRAQLDADPVTVTAVVALHGDEAICAARLEVPTGGDFAMLLGGGTVPGWRGRGLYRALTAYRARVAAVRGCRWLQVDAGAESRPILSRLGFTAVGATTAYSWRP